MALNSWGIGQSKKSRFASMGSLGSQREQPIEVLGKKNVRNKGTKLGIDVQIQSEELTISVGAQSLCDAVSRALTLHHANAIASGTKPSGGAQAPLNPKGTEGMRAKAGKRPSARGHTGKPSALPPNLTRGAIQASGKVVVIGAVNQFTGIGPKRPSRVGTVARATITPERAGQADFIVNEAAEGREFFAVDGAADRVIEAALVDYLATVFDGFRTFGPEETKARDLAKGR